MWGRKDKKDKRGDRKRSGGSKGGAGMPFMGLGVQPGAAESEEALEAELLALQGKPPKKGKSPKSSPKSMSMKDIDTMMAGLDGIGDDEGDDDDEGAGLSDGEDDSALLAELQEIAEGSDEEEEEEATPIAPPTAPPTRQPNKSSAPSRAAGPSPQMSAITERLAMYENAVRVAKEKGESSKVRRYSRALDSIKSMQKKAQSGKTVNLDDLPPPILSGGGGGGPQPTISAPPTQGGAPQKMKDDVISDDELMAWAGSGPSQPPQTKPRPQVKQAPPPQPKPRPPPPPTTSDGRIDLDTPEFDEFNLTDEDMAMLAAQMDSSKAKSSAAAAALPAYKPPQPSPPQPKPRSLATPPQPKPRPPPPSTTSDGRIDLDAPEFDEFNLTDEDMAMLAAQMDNDNTKKRRVDAGPAAQGVRVLPTQPSPRKPAPSLPSPAQSLPATLTPSGAPSMNDVQAVLGERRDQYKVAMRQAKAQGGTSKAKEFGTMVIQFKKSLEALEQGREINLSQMPPPPPGFRSKYNFDLSKFKSPTQSPPQPSAVARETPQGAAPAESPDNEPEADSSIPVPRTVMEALEQRLAKYQETQRLAQEKEDSSRVRRLGRIVKQYEEAVKATKVGKPYNYSELPDPPGYPPIPAARPARQPPQAPLSSLPPSLPNPTRSLPPPQRPTGSKFMPNPSVSHDQVKVLTQRQQELLAAVKEAKLKGDKETALHYLKQYKGMGRMMDAANSGLPVDLTQVPPSPYVDVSKTKPSAAVLSHLRPAAEGDERTFERIKTQLQTQISICERNAKTYEEIKNVGTATQYQNMGRELQQELLAIEGIQSKGLGPPRFTMETRKFTVVHTHTYLSAQQCEVEVVGASAIPKPAGYEEKDMNVYVEVEFPWPNDSPQKTYSDAVRDTCNPEFNYKEKFEIERKHTRSILRVLKRNPLKCSLWQKRTLRKALFIGQAVFQIEKLETHSELRATLDLLDEKGRKPVGGNMEVVARLREPFTGKDSEEKEEQWLVFQEAIAAPSAVQMPRPSPTSSLTGSTSSPNTAHLSPVKVETTTSVEALKVELSLVQSALKAGHKDAATVQKGRQIQAKIQVIRQRLQSDPQFRGAYTKQVAKEMQLEQTLEGKLTQAGRTREAKILQLRRQAMQQEVKTMTGRK